jgi:hypothetical protein
MYKLTVILLADVRVCYPRTAKDVLHYNSIAQNSDYVYPVHWIHISYYLIIYTFPRNLHASTYSDKPN